MKRIILLLLMPIYSICLISKEPVIAENIMKEEIVNGDTVLWEKSEYGKSVFVKIKNDCYKNEGPEAYQAARKRTERKYKKAIKRDEYGFTKTISSKYDYFLNVILRAFPNDKIKAIINSKDTFMLIVKIDCDGTICNITFIIPNELINVFSSKDYYSIQKELKNNLVFEAPEKYGIFTGLVQPFLLSAKSINNAQEIIDPPFKNQRYY